MGIESSIALACSGAIPSAIDGVSRETHGGGDRLRTGIESRRIAHIVAGKFRNRYWNPQAEDTLDCSKNRLRQAVFGDTAHELRAHAVADCKQEHEKHEGLERL